MSEKTIEANTTDTQVPEIPAGPLPLDERLNKWAQESGLEKSAIIRMLNLALRQDRNLEFWSSVNLLEALPEPRFPKATARTRLIQYLNTVRNVAVFFPVALTWAAISVATNAFGKFSMENKATTVNFLAFWQNGYDYLSNGWKIGAVAKFDVIIIIGIILLTLVIGRLQFDFERDQYEFFEEADEERIEIAMELQNYILAHREVTAETIDTTVLNSIGTVRSMAAEMTTAMNLLHSSMQTLGKLVPQVTDVSADLVATSKATNVTINELVTSLSSGVKDATEVLTSISTAVADLGTNAASTSAKVTEAQNNLDAAGTKLNSTVNDFEQSAAELKDRLDSGLAAAIDKSSNAIDDIVNEMSVTGTSLKSSARSVQDQLEELQRSISRQNKK